jgi:hypothetical protein
MRNLTKKFEFGVTLSQRNFETVFSKSKNTEFILKKCYGAEIFANGKLIKVIKSN